MQHALRAFTPDDAAALKATVGRSRSPISTILNSSCSSSATGEAAVTILGESGVPTPVVHTKLRPPHASMGPAADVESVAEGSRSMPSTALAPTRRLGA